MRLALALTTSVMTAPTCISLPDYLTHQEHTEVACLISLISPSMKRRLGFSEGKVQGRPTRSMRHSYITLESTTIFRPLRLSASFPPITTSRNRFGPCRIRHPLSPQSEPTLSPVEGCHHPKVTWNTRAKMLEEIAPARRAMCAGEARMGMTRDMRSC